MPPYASDDAPPRGRRDFAVAVAAIIVAGVLLVLPSPVQQRLAAAVRTTALRPFLAAQEALASARVRAAEAEELRERVDSLVAALTARAPLEEENRRLRRLLSLEERSDPRFEAAEMVRPGVAGSESMFLTDVGRRHGVREGAPVVTGGGLVGVIREVSERVSVGMDWTHPDFRASAMTRDGETYGIVEARRGRFREEDRMVLTGTAYHTALEPGTPIVTSGRGGVFPRGIPLGRVVEVEDAEAGWRKSYTLEAAVRPGSVTHVLVAVPGRAGAAGVDTTDVDTTGVDTTGVDTTGVEGLWRIEDAGEESIEAPPDTGSGGGGR